MNNSQWKVLSRSLSLLHGEFVVVAQNGRPKTCANALNDLFGVIASQSAHTHTHPHAHTHTRALSLTVALTALWLS